MIEVISSTKYLKYIHATWNEFVQIDYSKYLNVHRNEKKKK